MEDDSLSFVNNAERANMEGRKALMHSGLQSKVSKRRADSCKPW